jgi:hypothetical protein
MLLSNHAQGRNFRPIFVMSDPISWTAEATERLKEIPFFVRPAARKKIENFAREAGITEITETVYEQAKQKFN